MRMMASTRFLALASSITWIIHSVLAERATVRPEDDIPEWQEKSSLTMRMGTVGDVQDPIDYVVVPLTETLGLNGTERTRGVCPFPYLLPSQDVANSWRPTMQAMNIEGMLVWIKPENFEQDRENQDNEVAYISCEDPVDSDVTANDMVNTIMDKKPKAILLYSSQTTSCALEGQDLSYQSILTFVDSSDSLKLLDILNKTNDQDEIKVYISGNTTDTPVESMTPDRGDHSAVAMSILYSITGLITMLFLLIIAAGAIRAHRYPERYGPRGADGGHGRQSRAKGIARAVLDTIPIVKFGEPSSPKKAPTMELDVSSVRNVRDLEAGIPRATSTPDTPDAARKANGTAEANVNMASPRLTSGTGGASTVAVENLDCTICTDKFVVGEDVRVLPCDHKYHPGCIDPWLTEVSGTCPLWYVHRPNLAPRLSNLE
jgi:hypothetical protein